MFERRHLYLLGAMALAIAGGAACGDDYGNNSPSGSSGTDRQPTAVAGVSQVTIEAGNFFFSPNTLRGEPGQQLTLTVKNRSAARHDLSIDEQSISRDIPTRETVDVVVTVPKSGSLTFYCKYHRADGMTGQLLAGDAAEKKGDAAPTREQAGDSGNNDPGPGY